MIKLPPLKYLKECFAVDFLNGTLFWKRRPLRHFKDARSWMIWNSNFSKNVAGGKSANGYKVVTISNKRYLQHRIIFYMKHSKINKFIDHADGDGLNNSIGNLRACSYAQNNWNVSVKYKPNGAARNVKWRDDTKSWRAVVKRNGIEFTSRLFKDLNSANNEAETMRKKLHGEFSARKLQQ